MLSHRQEARSIGCRGKRLFATRLSWAGAIQLALTVIALWTFGLHIAWALKYQALGVALMYIIPGLVGSLASANLSTHYTAAGAPAAVCGLIGAPAWTAGSVVSCPFHTLQLCQHAPSCKFHALCQVLIA